MKDTQLSKPESTLEIQDMGKATVQTCGTAYNVPYYENGFPPYNHLWPIAID